MKKHFILLMMAIPVLSLSSCMSIFSSTQQPITITGENGTKLYDAANNVKLAEIKEGGSTTFRLKKKLSDRTVIAKKEGYKNTPFVIESAFNAKALWNILFWPGFLIDENRKNQQIMILLFIHRNERNKFQNQTD